MEKRFYTENNQDEAQNLDHTRPMTRVSAEVSGMQETAVRPGKVRELDPVQVSGSAYRQEPHYQQSGQERYGNVPGNNSYAGNEAYRAAEPPTGKKSSFGTKAAIAAGVFLLGVLAVFALDYFDYREDQDSVKAQNEAAVQQIQEADAQKDDLNRQRSELEAKYDELLAQQQELQSLADKLEGQKQQQDKAQSEKSTAGKVLDTITGDAGKEKKQAQSTEQQAADAKTKLENVQQSVRDAKAALDEVDSQLTKLDKMRREAEALKDDAAETYMKNKSTIDSVMEKLSVGMDLLKGFLGN